MASHSNTIQADAVKVGGAINEDVVQKIFDITATDRIVADRIGSTKQSNVYKEWSIDRLTRGQVNKVIEGADIPAGQNNAKQIVERVGNFSQLSDAVVRVSTTLEASDHIGHQNFRVRQLIRSMQSLKLDEEFMYLGDQVAVRGDGAAVASASAGIGAWIKTNTQGGAGFAAAILSGAGGVGGFPSVAKVDSNVPQTLSFKEIGVLQEKIYQEGGDATLLLSSVGMITKIVEFVLGPNYVGVPLRTQVDQSAMPTGTSGGKQTAAGATYGIASLHSISTNWGSLKLCGSRDFPTLGAATEVDIYVLDLSTFKKSYLQPYKQEVLGRQGHSTNEMISFEASLCSFSEHASGMINNVDATQTVVV